MKTATIWLLSDSAVVSVRGREDAAIDNCEPQSDLIWDFSGRQRGAMNYPIYDDIEIARNPYNPFHLRGRANNKREAESALRMFYRNKDYEVIGVELKEVEREGVGKVMCWIGELEAKNVEWREL